MLTKKQYVEYLLITPLNYTCTNLDNHLDNVSHDYIWDFLRRERFSPRQLWELTKTYVSKQDDLESYLICVDSVQDKRYSRFIELVKKQYSLVKLFKIVSPDGHIDWVITNSQDHNLWTDDVKENNAVRWQVEEFHRAYKQLTGSEKCQCRAARSQRNHLACCYHAWVSLTIKAKELNLSLYQIRNGLFTDFLKMQ